MEDNPIWSINLARIAGCSSSVISILCFLTSIRFVNQGEVSFLAICGIVANVFYLTTSGLSIWAASKMWKDGFLASILMSNLSIGLAFIMAGYAFRLLRTDNQKPQEERRRSIISLMIMYCLQLPMFIAIAVCSNLARTSISKDA